MLKPDRLEFHHDSKQIKTSREIPIDRDVIEEVFHEIECGAIRFIPAEHWPKVTPPDRGGRTTILLAASGIPPGTFATEQVVRTIDREGRTLDKVYRLEFSQKDPGQWIRVETTHDWSTNTNAQVSDHHQDPETTKARFGLPDDWEPRIRIDV